MHADILVGLQQREQLGLVFEVGTGGIAKRIARAAILLMEEVADVRGVVAGDSQLLANLLVR